VYCQASLCGNSGYKDELEKLCHIYWNEEQIDGLNAWLKARNKNVLKSDKGLQPLVEKVELFLA
tara:strand:- start:20798 stop:20989 length:192 start_codon:yes stop_codon:yes gene_type:complete